MVDSDLIEAYERGRIPPQHLRMTGLVAALIVFFLVGYWACSDVWRRYAADILQLVASTGVPSWIASNVMYTILVLAMLFTVSLLLSLGVTCAAQRLGTTLIYVGIVLIVVVVSTPAVIPLFASGFNIVLILSTWTAMLPGGLVLGVSLLLVVVFRRRLKRAGNLVRLTGGVCQDNKAVLVPPVIVTILAPVVGVVCGAIALQFPGVIDAIRAISPWDVHMVIPVIVIAVVYLFIVSFLFNLSYSIVSAVTYIHIRGRQLSLTDGLKASMGLLRDLVLLSFANMLVGIARVAMRSGGHQVRDRAGVDVEESIGSRVQRTWTLLNCFTIPVMVAERQGVRQAIRRSTGLLRRSFADVLIKETAVRWALKALAAVFVMGLGIAGIVTGWYLSGLRGAILIGLAFVIFSAIPSGIILRTLDIVYVTLLYVFVRQQEGDIKGRTAIPGMIYDELLAAYRSAKMSRSL
ncbi:MAG: hypothetical protein QXS20_09315 [Candidatus Thorarchaeota archaeon]